MRNEIVYRVLDARCTAAERAFHVVLTYSLLGFCIWLSSGSTFWTFICGCSFLLTFLTIASNWALARTNYFYSAKELQEWAATVKDPR